ncbi:hypothetical protein SpCBS45565_g03115 [Spizellomyces sp. 'palustris']|nr:hypothetical protein SpCBS45565_g03115 [Spizellomyces sp. 'palustris']
MQQKTFEEQLLGIVARRRQRSLLRTTPLPPSPPLIDFSSNDYLGLAHNPHLHDRFLSALQKSSHALGSTGSRLLNGNSREALSLETFLADFHNASDALLFNSGYDANLSLLSTLPQPDSAVVYDELVHASMHDGIKLGRAKYAKKFKHNNVDALRDLLTELLVGKQGQDEGTLCKTAVVAVESLYSMDGDIAPLEEIVQVVEEFDGRACLVVDEAHSTGVFGSQGRGLVCALGLESRVYARLHTFGKAIGSHGAVVLGSPTLREYLVNYARPLVYSTMISYHGLVAIRCSYEYLMEEAVRLQTRMTELVQVFRQAVGPLPPGATLLPSDSMIQGIVLAGNARVVALATRVQAKGFDVRPIRSPTVPKGTERLRVCLHAHNTRQEVLALAAAIRWAVEEVIGRSLVALPKL